MKNVRPLIGHDNAEESLDNTKVWPWSTDISKEDAGAQETNPYQLAIFDGDDNSISIWK